MGEVSIEVKIADRPYKMKVSDDQKDLIHQAAQLINEKIEAYEKTYAFHDYQDLLAMVLLEISSDLVKQEIEQSTKESQAIKRLQEIEKMFSDLK